MRSIPFLLLTFLATSSITAPPDPHAAIHAVPVALDPSDPARSMVGSLRFLGGWELTSKRPDFGGISSLQARNGHFLAISDAGWLIRFTLRGDGAIVDTRFTKLPGGPGVGTDKADRDSESLAVDPVSGEAWIGFERHNAIWRYSPDFARAQSHVEPPAMAGWPPNAGPETITRLSDGRFIVIRENGDFGAKPREALLFAGDPTRLEPISFTFLAPLSFAVTDAAELPDGRLLVLERYYSMVAGTKAALAILDPREIKPGAKVAGRLIARLAPPLTIDNMEGLSIERVEGRTILWIVSDDNFSPLQRTLLMKFELVE
jgi:hypothetical protein